ncbi:cytochrome c oxidase subunit IV [Gammaproteobacteria bacterium]
MSNVVHSQPHPVSHYINVWVAVLALFIISITVSQLSNYRPLVLITAFGIATIQAILVGAYFMHLKGEKKYIYYLLFSMLLALAMLYFGTVSDNGHPSGKNWTTTDTLRIMKEHEGHPAGHTENNSTVHH